MTRPPLSFTQQDSDEAYGLWSANCGPHALAAAAGVTLGQAVDALPGFRKKRYTNPSMMTAGLQNLRRRCMISKGLIMRTPPVEGVARVQWEGRWLDAGVPPIAAYHHTHWVSSRDGHIFCTAAGPFGWIPFEDWVSALGGVCLRNKYTGWHFTHHYLLI